jgi:FAS-associated factor 2
VSNVLLATRYPFVGIVAPQGSRMVVVDRLEGLMSADVLVSALDRQLQRMDHALEAIRAERTRNEQNRILREQQEEAYRASLKADQEKVHYVFVFLLVFMLLVLTSLFKNIY